MSSILNPLHPTTLFLQKKLGQQFLSSVQIVMPPGSTLNFQVAPPSGRIWITVIQSSGPPRDVTTMNPVVTGGVYCYTRHSMIVSANTYFGLESNYRTPWALEMDLRVNDPLNSQIVNTTALTLVVDLTYAIMEITADKYDQYMQLWNGLYNFEWLMGSLSENDVLSLTALLKSLRLTPPEPPIPKREVTTAPTLGEDIGKPIGRIEIP